LTVPTTRRCGLAASFTSLPRQILAREPFLY
jgi:hypothetical protein